MVQRNSVLAHAGNFAAAALFASTALYSVQASAAGFNVEINQSRALKLDAPASAVMVGNPAIADVTVLGPQLIYVLGRSYGKTNFVALDANGKQISAFDVNVVAQANSTVTLTRGAGQLTYNCTPRCERVVAMGDDSDAFSATSQQTMGVAGLARSQLGASGQPGNLSTLIGSSEKAEASNAPEE
ncbi:MAG: pilus assembly protein N-terminal domain-containing protein [Pseudomonadota bacterium]